MQQNDTVMVIFGFSQLYILFIQNFELTGLRILISAVLSLYRVDSPHQMPQTSRVPH